MPDRFAAHDERLCPAFATLQPRMVGNIETATRVWMSDALVRGRIDMESPDDQLPASWHGGSSVSDDDNTGARRGRNRNETLVCAGGPPSAARRRYSGFGISADPRSRRRDRRPQNQQYL